MSLGCVPQPVLITRSEMAGMRTRNYVECLSKFGIGYVKDLPLSPVKLYVTNCCGTKGINIPHGTPEVFYKGKNQQRFIARMKQDGLEWAILSDLYGIHFSDESLPLYDLAPNQLSQQDLWDKGALIRAKLKQRYDGIPEIVYVKTPPSTAIPYLIMMRAAGCRITISSSCA